MSVLHSLLLELRCFIFFDLGLLLSLKLTFSVSDLLYTFLTLNCFLFYNCYVTHILIPSRSCTILDLLLIFDRS